MPASGRRNRMTATIVAFSKKEDDTVEDQVKTLNSVIDRLNDGTITNVLVIGYEPADDTLAIYNRHIRKRSMYSWMAAYLNKLATE